MLSVAELLLFEALKASDQLLSTKDVLKMQMDEDLMLRDLDKAWYHCPLGPPLSPLVDGHQDETALDVMPPEQADT